MRSELTYGSLFSGIGGFDLGFDQAGFQCLWQVESDQKCRSILERHWPQIERLEDVRTANAANIVRPEWIVGGFPCQDLSVAGRRAGLAGERSGLFHEFMRIVGELSPSGVVIENVPGILSSNGGRDMGIVLGALAKLGYGFAYRVLDAQWFGVAQRRKRVFIVGCLGDWRRAAEILFEPESLPWDSPPSREAGTRVAAKSKSGPVAYRTSGNCGVMEQGDKTAALNCGTDLNQNIVSEVPDVARSVTTREGQRMGCEQERNQQQAVTAPNAVRRLLPVECERLQGFPDHWTRWGHDGAEISDSARYRMLGNAVAVVVSHWLAARVPVARH